VREAFVAFVAMIVIYSCALIFKLKLFAAAIFKTMKVDFYAELMQGFYLIKNINHSAIISRIWHIK
jgi:hypothetical protein